MTLLLITKQFTGFSLIVILRSYTTSSGTSKTLGYFSNSCQKSDSVNCSGDILDPIGPTPKLYLWSQLVMKVRNMIKSHTSLTK